MSFKERLSAILVGDKEKTDAVGENKSAEDTNVGNGNEDAIVGNGKGCNERGGNENAGGGNGNENAGALGGSAKAKKTKRLYITLLSVAAVLILLTVVGAIYVNDYYRAEDEAIADAIGSDGSVEISEIRDGVIAFIPEGDAEVGFIFYPGGKVEYTAYIPLMYAMAERGVLSVLCEMPFNLAVLNVNAADGITEQFSEVRDWYIGGHSLGGSMAASYLDGHPEIAGLVLLGSYSTADVSDKRVISIYGERDGVMNREKYEQYRSNLPSDFAEVVIEGGNHAYFGMYGEQDGDGRADITPTVQIEITANEISKFIYNR